MGKSSSKSSKEENPRMTLLESLSTNRTSEDWPSRVGEMFCKAVDSDRKMLFDALHPDVELMWFGRSLPFTAPKYIVKFLDTTVQCSHHKFISAVEVKSSHNMDVTDDESDEESATETERKRPAASPFVFDELRAERNNQKNRENQENNSNSHETQDENNNEQKPITLDYLKHLLMYITPTPGVFRKATNVNIDKKVKNIKLERIRVKARLFMEKEKRIWEKKLNALYLEIAQGRIVSIEYIGDSCARNLMKDFDRLDESDE